jgi:hypothetical protein
MNDKDDDYPSISEVTTIMREGGDNEAQCYAYRYVSEEQDKGNFCKYMQKNWKWKTALEDRSENNYNEENEHEKITDFLNCQRGHNVFGGTNMQHVRVIFNKELFQTAQSAELFLYTMAQNLPNHALCYEVMYLRGGFDNTFALNYWSDEEEDTKELLAMLFAYRLHVDVPYNIELWEIWHGLSGYTHKENREIDDNCRGIDSTKK